MGIPSFHFKRIMFLFDKSIWYSSSSLNKTFSIPQIFVVLIVISSNLKTDSSFFNLQNIYGKSFSEKQVHFPTHNSQNATIGKWRKNSFPTHNSQNATIGKSRKKILSYNHLTMYSIIWRYIIINSNCCNGMWYSFCLAQFFWFFFEQGFNKTYYWNKIFFFIYNVLTPKSSEIIWK